MSQPKRKMEGKMGIPLLVLGGVSFLLALATDGLGIFASLENNLRGELESGGFSFSKSLGLLSVSGVILGLAVCFGMAGMVLGSPGTWRRVMLGLSLLIVTAMVLPVFAAWGIFWKPFSLVLGVLWAWFSALFYTSRHRMPCEGIRPVARVSNVIPMTRSANHIPEKRSKNRDGAR